MKHTDHKAIRRAILETLYAAYLSDPLRMVEPEALFARPPITRENIIPNIHYLYDRKLVEMMMGYTPPMFSAVRITTTGIDMVEDRYTFNLQFPEQPDGTGEAESAIPYLVEQLVAQGDLTPLDGWTRRQLLGDIQFLRTEVAQHRSQWRPEVIHALLDWIELRHQESDGGLAALSPLRAALNQTLATTEHQRN